jgi:hypothetical protein
MLRGLFYTRPEFIVCMLFNGGLQLVPRYGVVTLVDVTLQLIYKFYSKLHHFFDITEHKTKWLTLSSTQYVSYLITGFFYEFCQVLILYTDEQGLKGQL